MTSRPTKTFQQQTVTRILDIPLSRLLFTRLLLSISSGLIVIALNLSSFSLLLKKDAFDIVDLLDGKESKKENKSETSEDFGEIEIEKIGSILSVVKGFSSSSERNVISHSLTPPIYHPEVKNPPPEFSS